MVKEQYENERLDDLQNLINDWHNQNFGHVPTTAIIAKLTEEVGEAAHAAIRLYHHSEGRIVDRDSQGNLVTSYGREAELKDAIGDIVIVLMNLSNAYGWYLSNIIEETVEEVLQRDYTK